MHGKDCMHAHARRIRRVPMCRAQKEVKAGAKLKFNEHYRLGQVVGTGHYARVQLAMSLKDGKKYAVKILKKQEGKEALLLQLQSKSTHTCLADSVGTLLGSSACITISQRLCCSCWMVAAGSGSASSSIPGASGQMIKSMKVIAAMYKHFTKAFAGRHLPTAGAAQ